LKSALIIFDVFTLFYRQHGRGRLRTVWLKTEYEVDENDQKISYSSALLSSSILTCRVALSFPNNVEKEAAVFHSSRRTNALLDILCTVSNKNRSLLLHYIAIWNGGVHKKKFQNSDTATLTCDYSEMKVFVNRKKIPMHSTFKRQFIFLFQKLF